MSPTGALSIERRRFFCAIICLQQFLLCTGGESGGFVIQYNENNENAAKNMGMGGIRHKYDDDERKVMNRWNILT